MIKVTCLGAAGCVTGSCFLVENTSGKRVLVDCGLFQGGKQMELRNLRDWDFVPSQISTLFLTHAHIDHSGTSSWSGTLQGEDVTSPRPRSSARSCSSIRPTSGDGSWQTRKNRRRASGGQAALYYGRRLQSLQYIHRSKATDHHRRGSIRAV